MKGWICDMVICFIMPITHFALLDGEMHQSILSLQLCCFAKTNSTFSMILAIGTRKLSLRSTQV